MSVTQKTIAERVGVSRSSVAAAINGVPTISDETRLKVMSAARELGYTQSTNLSARSLAAKRYGQRVKSGAIATMMATFNGGGMRGVPFFAPILDGIELEAGERTLDVYQCYHYKDRPVPRMILEGGVDGVIALGSNPVLLIHAGQLEIPIVSIAGRLPVGYNIVPNSREGIGLAVRHLADLGHRNIAYFGPALCSLESVERHEAFEKAMAMHGLPYRKETMEMKIEEFRFGAQSMSDLLSRSRDFTALVCYNDEMAMQAIPVMEEQGLRVPEDVSVVGFDDISVASNFKPAITSIAFDRLSMGRRAVEFICERTELLAGGIDAAALPQWEEEVYPVELVVRESTRRLI